MVATKMVKISDIHKNPKNPRIIKDSNFKKLVKSVKNFPEMLKLRPIVCDGITYKTIFGYDGYLFGSNGSVWSFKKSIKEVIGAYDKDGYLKITLIKNDGHIKYFRKHRLIMLAFVGESNLEVNHIDGNKINNNINNLEYVTLQENQCHWRAKKGFSVGFCWCRKSSKYRSYIQINKKWSHLGFFIKAQDAKNAYLDKLKELKILNKYSLSVYGG